MNDLDLMTEFRQDVAPPEQTALTRARAGMFRAAPEKRKARWVWRLAPAGALVAAVAVAGVAIRPDTGPPPPPSAGSGVTGESEAVQVLRLAAAEARREPVLAARPGQFVYIRSQVSWAGIPQEGQPERPVRPAPHERQIWLSTDGNADGLLREGPDFDDVPLIDGRGIRAYRDDLPTEVKAMRAYLYKGARDNPPKPGGPTPDDRAWSKVGDTLREQYVPPAAVAALYDAAATIPGTSVVKSADLAGRKGTAVARTSDFGVRTELIFDSRTHRLLGERTVAVRDLKPGIRKGEVTGFTAQLKIAIVDRAGQLP
jgi:hypothetical protein